METIKIAVIGLGYVGLPLARLFSTKYPTIGFDMNQKRVDALMEGYDATLEVSDELYPVIVEIKREKATAYSTPNVNEICAQIYNYQKGLSTELSKEYGFVVAASDIRAYFICGKAAFDKLDINDRTKLKQAGIELRYYDELIRTAKRIFEVSFGEDLESL